MHWQPLLLLILAPLGQVQDQRPALKITPPLADLGPIVGGPPLSTRLELHNPGSVSLDIMDVTRSCGCLAPRLEKRTLTPGEKTILHMDLRTLGLQDGPHAWNAAIVYRLGDETARQPFTVKAVIRNEIVIQPSALAMHVADRLEQVVRLHDRRDQPLAVRQVRTSFRQIQAEVQVEKPGMYRIVIQASAAELPAGRQDGFLDIYTDDPKYAHLQIPLTLSRVDRSDILCVPDAVRLRPGETSRPVRLRSRRDQALAIDNVDTSVPGLTCTWAVGEDGSGALKIRAQGDVAPGSYEVRVHVGQPAREVVRINVEIDP